MPSNEIKIIQMAIVELRQGLEAIKNTPESSLERELNEIKARLVSLENREVPKPVNTHTTETIVQPINPDEILDIVKQGLPRAPELKDMDRRFGSAIDRLEKKVDRLANDLSLKR